MRRVRRYLDRRQIQLADVGLDISKLWYGPGPRGWGDTITSIKVAKEVYENHRDELTAMRSAEAPFGHKPGCRNWCEWTFDLLPDEPRRSVTGDGEVSHSAPSTCPWSSDGFEPSVTYLHRRGLLKPNELAAIRYAHPHPPKRSEVLPKYRDDCEPLLRAEAAALALIYGMDLPCRA